MSADRKWIERNFDPALADRLVGVIAGARDTLNLSHADADWGMAQLWTHFQMAPVTNVEEAEAYASEIAQILVAAGAPMSREKYAAFLRTPEGMRALSLQSRLNTWQSARN